MWYQPGDVVCVRVNGFIQHEGIMTETGRVISNSRRLGCVCEESTRAFAGGRKIELVGRLSNMSPEFGATATLFPVDSNTVTYLQLTGRGELVDLVERYTQEQGLFRTDDTVEPHFSEVIELDLDDSANAKQIQKTIQHN